MAVHDYVYLEIVQTPATVSRDDLARVAQSIAPFGSGVMLRLPSGFDRFDQVPAQDLLSVGMNLPLEPRPDPEILAEIRAFAAETSALGISRHVHGLQSTPLAMGAAYAGFEFVGSGAAASLEASEPDTSGAPFDMFNPIAASK